MTQQPDLTIPFDASVVDEEALRALRAVQRAVPVGDGGASGNLVGGTEAVAAFGMVPGAPTGGGSAATAGIAPLAETQAARPIDVALGRLETPSLSGLPIDIRRVIADAPEVASTLVRSSVSAKAGAVAGSSSTPPSSTGSSFEPGFATVGPSEREDQAVVAPPSVDQPTPGEPQPEEPRDTMASPPRVQVADASGEEDQPIALDLTAILGDTDGSEALSITIFGVPEGASLTHGTRQPDGSWTVSPADLQHLGFVPPENFSGTVSLTLRATSQEVNGGTSFVDAPFRVQVHAVADAPAVTVADAHGHEDVPVSLAGLGGALRDTDGSESLSFVLSGVPEGATLSAGTALGGGRWALTPAQLEGLTFTPPLQASGSFTLTLTAIATESEPGVPSARTSATFNVVVDPVADAGTISGTSMGSEDAPILLRPTFMSPDADGSESWAQFTQVAGLPAGASLNRGTEIAPGLWQVATADLRAGLVTIRPAAHSDADFTLTLTATLIDSANGTSASRVVTGTHSVTVTAVADAPSIAAADVSGDEDQPIPLDLSARLVDTDGSEVLSVSILGVPDGASLSHGTRQSDGSWSVSPADLGVLSITPPRDFSGTIRLTLTAVATESEPGVPSARSSTTFNVIVDPVADAGTVSGASAGPEDTEILLQPTFVIPDGDGSESWAEFTQVAGLPAGASLNRGTEIAPGVWQVSTADLQAGLIAVRPAEHSDQDFALTLTATLIDSVDGRSASRVVTGTHTVAVSAVADAPTISAANVTGDEDRPIPLKLSAALVDADGSEVLSVRILGVPADASLSHGVRQADGSWSVPPTDLAHLTITAPKDFSGTINLTLEATTRETSNGSIATRSTGFQVEVDNVSDAPAVSVQDASGPEDRWAALDLSAALTDTDGSETLSVSILGVPPGASLSRGNRAADGSWHVDVADLSNLSILPPENFSGTISLTLRAVSLSENGSTATTDAPFRVHVEAVADIPQAGAHDAATKEDQPAGLDLLGALTDIDGSEVLSFVIEGLPPGAQLSAGKDNGDGTWSLSPAQLTGLKITPPADWSGTMALTLVAQSRETSNGSTATTRVPFKVEVEAVADAPQIVVHDVKGLEDTPVALDLSATLKDRDGSEVLSVAIFGVPADVGLSHGIRQQDGSWSVSPADLPHLSLMPQKDFSGVLTLRIEATAKEGNGDTRTSSAAFRVEVGAVADTPDVTVANFSGREDEPVVLKGLGGALRDLDGSESLSFLLTVPAGATLNVGVKQADGRWLLTPAQLDGVILTPPPNVSGRITLTLTAVATESDPSAPAAQNSAPFTVDLDPVLDTGTIGGSGRGNEDTWIRLKPSFGTPDVDGSEQWSETTQIIGVPAGATLSRGTLADGVWTVSTADLQAGRVYVKPPVNSDEDFSLTLKATLSDTGNGKTVHEEVTGTYGVKVLAVTDAPNVSASDVSGKEDQAIALDLSASLVDTDGSETLAVRIYGVPSGASLTKGTPQSDGSWLVDAKDLSSISLKPPADFSGTIDLRLEATAKETSTGRTEMRDVSFQVTVDAVADAPGLRVAPAFGDEDTAIPLNMTAWTTDRDGSEKIVEFRITGIPNGATVRAGGMELVAVDGSVLVDPAQVNSLTITPPAQSDADFSVRVVAVSAEPNGSTAESEPRDIPVTVRAVADAPVMDVTSASGLEDTPIALNLTATLPDSDGSEALSFVIRGVPDGAIMSHGTYRGPGVWSLTAAEAKAVTLLPPANFSGTINLSVTAVSQEERGGDEARTPVTFPVEVKAVVDVPAVGGLDGVSGNWGAMHGTEDRPIALRLDPGLTDSDNSEKVVGDILISGVPDGAVLRLADDSVVTPDEHGVYRIAAKDMTGITLTMPHDSDRAATLHVTMMIEDSGGVRATIGGQMVVDPLGDADTPVLTFEQSTGTGHTSINPDDGRIPLHITALPGDNDGSETLYIWVRNVPDGAVLSAGIPAGEKLWLVPVESLPTLSIRPPAGFTGSFNLTVTAVGVEREGDQADRTEIVPVTVTAPVGGGEGTGGGSGTTPGTAPVAQAPGLTVHNAVTNEDNAIVLSIDANTNDTDSGRETLGIRIEGVPAGAYLSAGVRDPATGAWVLRPDQLTGLTLTPPADFSGTITLKVAAVSTEATGSQTSTIAALNVDVTPVADHAVIGANPPAGVEDTGVPLNLSVTASDRDGSESVTSIVISNLPAGARLEGTGLIDLGGGKWRVEAADLASLRFVPPPDKYGTFELKVEATTQEGSNGVTQSTSRTISVSVAPAADAPTIEVHNAAGNEDGTISLNVSAQLTDTDGSEVLSVVIEGLPEGARLSTGINNGDGSWTLTPSQLAGLTVTPPGDWSGTMNLTLLAHARETSNGSVATTRGTFQVQVDAVSDAPVVSARDASGLEDQPIALNLSAALTDRDGSEVLTVVISGMPAGARLSHGSPQGDGTWIVSPADLPHLEVTPPENYSGTFSLTIRATAQESAGVPITSEASFRVQVGAVADAPEVIVSDATGSEDTTVSLAGLGGSLRDTDGSETLEFVLSGVPAGASLNAGMKQADGSWLLTPAQLTGLTLTPPAQFSGEFTLTLTGVATEKTGGSTARTSADFTVSLNPVADAGTIGGMSAGAEDTSILIKPTFTLQDNDGSEAWSEFTQVSGLPTGASLTVGSQQAPGTWLVSTSDLRAGLVSVQLSGHSDADFTLTLKATITDTGNGVTSTRDVTGTHLVTVAAVADAPEVTARDVLGQEDHAIALDLSAALVDTDGSETLSVTILGIPADCRLSQGEALAGGAWRVPAGALTGLQLIPADDWHGTLHLTLQATSTEATGETATTTTPFTVTIEPVNDAPELTLTAPAHAGASAHQAHAIGAAQASDIDSTQLGGATITLSGGQPNDRLDFDGYALHDQNGHLMIGDTGIEVVGGGYVAGALTLSGHAKPETYAAVLQSLVLESSDAAGLAAGSRSISVTLHDSEGATSTPRSVEIVVDEPPPAAPEVHGLAAGADSGTTQELSGSDILLLMADGVLDPGHDASSAWTDQVSAGDPHHAGPHPSPGLDQPVADTIQPIDDLHIDTARTHWS
ncbi:Ig-like domain-containing protein [Microvirga terrae]|uniref:Ig-like domain-containing protein n=1 Tax=Microvirga terrae TaxID=2740529 RepID=A0ABY5RKJ3_9HYPH|nr:Ig-like domain-containing protein [Microvirga terrae]UVF17498.1 Ig-like domain-containing protein [Microvirga terrae]